MPRGFIAIFFSSQKAALTVKWIPRPLFKGSNLQVFSQVKRTSPPQRWPGQFAASWGPFAWLLVGTMEMALTLSETAVTAVDSFSLYQVTGCMKGFVGHSRDTVIDICAAWLSIGMYLIVITRKRNVGSLLGHAVWKAVDFDVISYKKTILHLSEIQVEILSGCSGWKIIELQVWW